MILPSWSHVFYMSRPPRGVSNMVVPSWHHVFSRVQATSTTLVPSTFCSASPWHVPRCVPVARPLARRLA
eukprot:6293209-Pyramimonas_sp.AAC.1